MSRIKNQLIKKAFFSDRLKLIESKQKAYHKYNDSPEKIVNFQLDRFNKVWGHAKYNHPFYRYWSEKHHLPDSIGHLGELNSFPVLKKADLQEGSDLIFPEGGSYQVVSTGGSSGEPVKFPTRQEEKDFEYANTYLARLRYGIRPLDKTSLLWGHSHLFGSGIKGKINQLKRSLSDWLINIERLNAYDLSIHTIEHYLDKIIRYKPTVIIGYTSSVFKIARFILDNNISISLNTCLKGVIVTSETATKNDIDVIERAFTVPVILEYGMAETSVIAYSNMNTHCIDVFWDSFIAQTDRENNLSVTTLNDRLFPLIRYDTSDRVIASQEVESSILSFSEISGRAKDNVTIGCANGSFLELSGILLVHILKAYPELYSISYKQQPDHKIQLFIVASKKQDIQKIYTFFNRELKKDHPEIDEGNIEIFQVSGEQRTIAGKTKTNLS